MEKRVPTGIPITEDNLSYVAATTNSSATLDLASGSINPPLKGAFEKVTGIISNPFPRSPIKPSGLPIAPSPTLQANNATSLMGVAEIFSQPTLAMWSHYLSIENLFLYLFKWEGLEGLKGRELETKLVRAGSVAIVRQSGVLVALSYTTLEWDIYNAPVRIKVCDGKSPLNGREYGVKDFVILYHQPSKYGLWNQIVRLLGAWEQAFYQLTANTQTLGTQWFVSTLDTDRTATSASALENALLSGQKVHAVNTEAGRNVSEVVSSIETKSYQSDLQLTLAYYDSLINQTIGLAVDFNKKKERLVTDEVDNAQAFTNQTLQMLLAIRQEGVADVNEKFGVQWKVSVLKTDITEKEDDHDAPA